MAWKTRHSDGRKFNTSGSPTAPRGRAKRTVFFPKMKPEEKPVPLKSPPPPPFHYEGGKFRQRHKIVEKMPPHKTYVEPFAGAANVLEAKPPSQKEVLGDRDPKIMKVHRGLKRKAEVWDMNPSRRKWEKIHSKPANQRTPEEQAYLVGHSYGGKVEDKRQNYHDSGKHGKLDTTRRYTRG